MARRPKQQPDQAPRDDAAHDAATEQLAAAAPAAETGPATATAPPLPAATVERVTPGVRVLRALERRWWLRTAFGCMCLGIGIGLVFVTTGLASGFENAAAPAPPDAPVAVAGGMEPWAAAPTQPVYGTPTKAPEPCPDNRPCADTSVDPAVPASPVGGPASTDDSSSTFVAQYRSAEVARARIANASGCFHNAGIVAKARRPSADDASGLGRKHAPTNNLALFQVWAPSNSPYLPLYSCITSGAIAVTAGEFSVSGSRHPASTSAVDPAVSPAVEGGPLAAPTSHVEVVITCGDPERDAAILEDTGTSCEELAEKLR